MPGSTTPPCGASGLCFSLPSRRCQMGAIPGAKPVPSAVTPPKSEAQSRRRAPEIRVDRKAKGPGPMIRDRGRSLLRALRLLALRARAVPIPEALLAPGIVAFDEARGQIFLLFFERRAKSITRMASAINPDPKISRQRNRRAPWRAWSSPHEAEISATPSRGAPTASASAPRPQRLRRVPSRSLPQVIFGSALALPRAVAPRLTRLIVLIGPVEFLRYKVIEKHLTGPRSGAQR